MYVLERRTNVYLCVKEDVAVFPVVTVTSGRPTCHLAAAPPPTLLADRRTHGTIIITLTGSMLNHSDEPTLTQCFVSVTDSSLPFACLDDAMRCSSLSASVALFPPCSSSASENMQSACLSLSVVWLLLYMTLISGSHIAAFLSCKKAATLYFRIVWGWEPTPRLLLQSLHIFPK